MLKHHLQMVVTFLLASSLTACGGGGGSLPSTSNTTSIGMTPIAIAPSSTVDTQGASRSTLSVGDAATVSHISIDAGGAANGTWLADADYTGGWPSSSTQTVNTGKVSNPAPQEVYQSQRTGTSLSYAIPKLTPNSAYTVRMHFAETFFQATGKRKFNVTINGKEVLANFDIFAASGGQNVAIVEQFATTSDASGKITVALASSVNNASIAGIEVINATTGATPAPSPTPTPVPSPSPIATPTPSSVGCAGNDGQGGNGTYPVTTCMFTGNTPMHETVAQLKSKGALTVQSAQMVVNFFKYNGAPSANSERTNEFPPVYVGTAADKSYEAICECMRARPYRESAPMSPRMRKSKTTATSISTSRTRRWDPKSICGSAVPTPATARTAGPPAEHNSRA